MTSLREEQLEELVLESELLTLISLGKEASGSSYLLRQRLQTLEDRYPNQIICYHLEVAPSSVILSTFNIAYLPSLLVFQNGELLEQCQASLPLDVLELKVKLLITQ
ncbi:MAG: hypothetical protein F6K19_42955 [Cyanothece sp. SIO1E1]|nr:hypothetical protein [Cyanothece sp. SIO1E1]